MTTNIKPDGRRIKLHNLGRNQSEKARKEIEVAYRLVKAEESWQREAYRLKPVDPQKVVYGRMESKRSMNNVITTVLTTYKYGSLAELNAVLQLYNICADRGSEGSRIFRHQGLVYHILDARGNKVGVPIKASDFQLRPTLKYLAERFLVNAAAAEQHKVGLRNTIDLALLRGELPLTELLQIWQKEGVDAVLRQNPDGVIYGITYVDHRSRCVFNGSALGRNYSAKAILQRCSAKLAGEGKTKSRMVEKVASNRADLAANGFSQEEKLPDVKDLADALFQPEKQPERMDWQLERKRKKRKRQQLPPA